MKYDDLSVHGRKRFDELAIGIAQGTQHCEVGGAYNKHRMHTNKELMCPATKIVWQRDPRLMVDLSKCLAVCDAHVSFTPYSDVKDSEGKMRVFTFDVMWPLEDDFVPEIDAA